MTTQIELEAVIKAIKTLGRELDGGENIRIFSAGLKWHADLLPDNDTTAPYTSAMGGSLQEAVLSLYAKLFRQLRKRTLEQQTVLKNLQFNFLPPPPSETETDDA